MNERFKIKVFMSSIFLQNASLFIKKTSTKIDWKCVVSVAVAFFITRLMCILITYFSMAQIPYLGLEDAWRYNPRNIIPDGLIRWDSAFYITIAQNSYDLKSTAFFPLYPLLIQLASSISGNSWTAGLYVSNLAFLISLFYLYALTKDEFNDETAGRTVFYIASAPAAFFFSTVYTESVFLLFIVACFYYSRKNKWFLASIAGALASATRLVGALAAVFILLEAFWFSGIRYFPKPWTIKSQFKLLAKNIRLVPRAMKGLIASVFSLSGLSVYMTFLYLKFRDPLAFLHAEQSWNRLVSWDWPRRLFQTSYDMHKLVGNVFSGGIGSIEFLMDTFYVIIFFPLVIIVLFRFRPSYGIFNLLAFLLPLISGSPVSMRRYVLTLIPCYILLAIWGKHPWVDRIIIGISLPLQAFFLILFSHWIFAG